MNALNLKGWTKVAVLAEIPALLVYLLIFGIIGSLFPFVGAIALPGLLLMIGLGIGSVMASAKLMQTFTYRFVPDELLEDEFGRVFAVISQVGILSLLGTFFVQGSVGGVVAELIFLIILALIQSIVVWGGCKLFGWRIPEVKK